MFLEHESGLYRSAGVSDLCEMDAVKEVTPFLEFE